VLIVIFSAYILIFLNDQIPLYKQGFKKDFYLSTVILTLSLIISVLITLRIKIPSPSKPLEQLVKLIIERI
jgi:hypothetical protein